ncbi:MAG: glycosyl transferase, family 25 [Burkholderiales bacterium]
MECFVINLPSDAARRAAIAAQLEALGLRHTIFNAVYGKHLSEAELARMYDRERAIEESHDLTLGEIGCALSHWGVYRQMVEKNISHALVLEDDARLGDALPDVVRRLEQQYASDKPMVVLLNYIEKYSKLGAKKLGDRHQLVDTYGGIPNAHGYFLTLAAAKNLAEGLYPIWLVADRWERFREEKLIQFKAVVPYCVSLTEHATQSNLTPDRVERMNLYRRGGLFYYLHRYVYKKFIHQLFIRPFLRVTKQKETW